jgi:hypothetical protein
MIKLRLLSTIALAGTLLAPSGAVLSQDETTVSPAPDATMAAETVRLAELEALVPPALAGLPLRENLQLATGEQMTSVMEPQEAAMLDELLALQGKTVADYAAAATYLAPSDTQIVYLQAHRIEGVDAALTVDAWVEILSAYPQEPETDEVIIEGHVVTVISDAANPQAARLHMFPVRDVVWMIWTDDEVLVAAAMDEVGAGAGAEQETSE